MMLPVFRDLIKTRWRVLLEELKHRGGQPVADLARATGGSYMAVKAACDELTKAGYLVRTRLPRVMVGRPEIHYSLAANADALFPQAGLDFSLELIRHMKRLYGDNAPERLLFQLFQDRGEAWHKALENIPDAPGKLTKLASLRTREGCASRCESEAGVSLRMVELHNPLQRLFETFPRAVAMELRAIEQAMGCRISRSEIAAGRETTPHVVFEVVGFGSDKSADRGP